ncbi:hypothetical protein DPMN_086693 [Dreissena polymorpha]|uniref:Uncharacterized protein n=1 Tax=Dreissena polymorpha TaxID=45954 RepID=A0A9D4KRH2_DREPO|nr:hypothetical protein DPMN_086693 [Dreissena polymorpha]
MFQCDRQTHRQTDTQSANHKSPLVKPRKLPHPLAVNVFPLITTIFKLIQHINKTNVLTKFHDDWPKNVTLRKTVPPLGLVGHVFSLITSIFKLNQDINKTNVLTKFHDDWTKNVTSRKSAPPPGGHVFSLIMTIFELVRDIYKIDVKTKFHDDQDKKCDS